jgi:hypothetical protein
MPRIRATTRPHRYGETFAHDRGTLGYFCREVDRPSGLPVLPTMIAEGIPVLSRSPALLEDARHRGRDIAFPWPAGRPGV